ncbi:MAG: hypothetical protein GX620_12880 [Chloroflexi bacterium]|nr:hypothetical protein [Chloroflexota bacterium]
MNNTTTSDPKPPMQRTIDLNLVNALKLFVSKDDTRFALTGVHFTRSDDGHPVAVATDGRKLAVIEQFEVSPDELPKFTNGGYPPDTGDSVTVPVKPLLDALKKVPKKHSIPILATPPLISIRNEKGDATQVCIPVTDLDTHSIETTKVIDAGYPTYQQVIPQEKDTVLEILFDAGIMLDMAQAAIDFAKNGSKDKAPLMKLCIGHHPGAALRVEVEDHNGRKMTMVAMPYKEGVLINRTGAGMAEAFDAIAGKLNEAVAKLETQAQPKARKGKKADGEEAA